MPECDNPLWPCAMTGAAACLAGFEETAVVIHGSSGCYYYPVTLLHAPLHGTFILEKEVVFGSEDRLREVVGELAGSGRQIAVITTCVPAVLGEDIRSMLADLDVILVDSPGFSGDVETGYKKAISVVNPEIDPERAGVNIDGVCLFDPFSRGNAQEIARLLGMVSVPVGTVFSQDKLDSARHSCPFTVGTNGDFAGGTGRYLGGTLGFDEIRMTFENVKNVWCEADVDVLFAELDAQEERIIRASDKFLRRFDPPGVAIFSGTSYAMFAAGTLSRYIDADIRCIGTRNSPCMSRFPAKMVTGLGEVKALIEAHDPDIVIGSSFERSVAANRGFVGIIPPLKGKIRLAYPALAGICGTLSFMENVLNACMDRKTATWKKRLSLPEE